MPKHGFLTPKAISNRIKSKGLQKLRWYCQMCQKQCRDENGFKCHTMSESHQRQLLLVAENPGRYVGQFSHEFFRDFMFLLSRQYGTRRVLANEVYQEYIKDKNHYHMNATRWTTLTGFCMFLGKEGICQVEPSEKGWYIKYIDRSPETLAREAASAKKSKMDRDDDERRMRMIEQQIERALASKKEEPEVEAVYTGLNRSDEEEKIAFSFKGESSASSSAPVGGDDSSSPSDPPEGDDSLSGLETTPTDALSETPPLSGMDGREWAGSEGGSGKEKATGNGFSRPKVQPVKAPALLPNALKKSAPPPSGGAASSSSSSKSRATEGSRKRKLGALEELRMMEEQRKEKMNRRDNWLAEGIVVKVVHQKLGERFYRKKGVVEEVRELYTAVVRMLESGDVIKIDQAHLETVIPTFGKPVLVVNGAYRGLRAILESLDTDNYCVSIKINQGPARGRVVDKVPYEDISKLAA